jgi:hypothetical protein
MVGLGVVRELKERKKKGKNEPQRHRDTENGALRVES